MKKLSVFLALLIILAVFGGSVIMGESHSEGSDETAKALSSLGLVQGYNGDFLVGESLTRAQAVTLILRLTDNDEVPVSDPGFSDVSESDWYYEAVAKSVSLGIVNGYPDGSFKPSQAVSQRAFLKMLLEVLAYRYESDFSWNQVLTLSKSVGLVEDAGEKMSFLREDAFNAMVRVLAANYHMTGSKYIERMKELGIIRDDQYATFSDEYALTDYAIEAVKVIESGRFMIELSRPASSGAFVNLISSQGQDLPLQYTVSDSKLIVSADTMVEGETYTLTLGGLTDSFGLKVNPISSTFVNKFSAADFDLYIDVSEITGPKYVELTFSHDLDQSSFTTGYYRVQVNGVNQFFSVEKLFDNRVLLVLRNELEAGDVVKVTVLNSLKDVYGFNPYDGTSYSLELVAEDGLADALRVEAVVPVGNGVVQVTFNQHVDPHDALKAANYEINDLSEGRPYMTVKRVIATGQGDLKYRVYDIVYDRFIDGNLYYLKTSNIDSLGGAYRLEKQQYRFTYNDNKPIFQVLSIEAVDRNHFIATFSQPIDEADLNKASMEIDGKSVYRRHMDQDSLYRVHLYMLLELDEDTSYYLKMENLVSMYDMEITAASKSFRTNEELRSDIQGQASKLSNGDYLITFNRMIDSFVKGGLVNITVPDQDGRAKILNLEDYKVCSSTGIIIHSNMLVEGAKEVTFNSVYLYGDGYYIGQVVVKL